MGTGRLRYHPRPGGPALSGTSTARRPGGSAPGGKRGCGAPGQEPEAFRLSIPGDNGVTGPFPGGGPGVWSAAERISGLVAPANLLPDADAALGSPTPHRARLDRCALL